MVFRFDMRCAASDPSGYYFTQWENATPISVFAKNAKQAEKKAKAAMGDPPGGKKWSIRLDYATEVVPPAGREVVVE